MYPPMRGGPRPTSAKLAGVVVLAAISALAPDSERPDPMTLPYRLVEPEGTLPWDPRVVDFHLVDSDRDGRDHLVTVVSTAYARLCREIFVHRLPDDELMGQAIVRAGDSLEVVYLDRNGRAEILASVLGNELLALDPERRGPGSPPGSRFADNVARSSRTRGTPCSGRADAFRACWGGSGTDSSRRTVEDLEAVAPGLAAVVRRSLRRGSPTTEQGECRNGTGDGASRTVGVVVEPLMVGDGRDAASPTTWARDVHHAGPAPRLRGPRTDRLGPATSRRKRDTP